MPSAELSAVGLRFLNERLRTAVQAAAAADDGAEDALRGLYISDEQALSLADGSAASPTPTRGSRRRASGSGSTRSTSPC